MAGLPSGRSGKNWYIDCVRSPSNAVFSPTDVRFQSVEMVVSKNWIDVGNGTFEVTGVPDVGAILYMQGADNSGTNKNSNPGLERGSQSTIRFQDVFVYSENGWIDVVGGAGSGEGAAIVWNSAERTARDTCPETIGALPPPGCFAPLALWSNSRHEHRLGGNAAMDVRGIFFTPNSSPFTLSGQVPQVLDAAQFFSHSFNISGQARIIMRPDPAFNDPTPIGGSGLIR